VRRGEVWLAEIGRKRRPVLVLTRSEVIDVLRKICASVSYAFGC